VRFHTDTACGAEDGGSAIPIALETASTKAAAAAATAAGLGIGAAAAAASLGIVREEMSLRYGGRSFF